MRTDFLAWLITAMAVTTSACAQDIRTAYQNPDTMVFQDTGSVNSNRQSLMLKRLEQSNPYSLYGGPARKFWSDIQQSFLPEYENKFYGKNIKITVRDENDEVLYFCTTSDPTLFWQLVLIPPEGDSVECEKANNENELQ